MCGSWMTGSRIGCRSGWGDRGARDGRRHGGIAGETRGCGTVEGEASQRPGERCERRPAEEDTGRLNVGLDCRDIRCRSSTAAACSTSNSPGRGGNQNGHATTGGDGTRCSAGRAELHEPMLSGDFSRDF